VDPQSAGVVYAAAGNKTNGGDGSVGIYKSTDCGGTWSKVSAPGSDLETGEIWQVVVDPVTPRTLYATNGYGNNPTIYKSTDGGVNFSPLTVDFGAGSGDFVRGFSMDPSDPAHLVACLHGTCNIASNQLCLSETHDGGATWKVIHGPPVSGAALGGDGGGPIIVSGEAMYYIHPIAGVFYTSDGGSTWSLHFQLYNYPANQQPNYYNPALPTTYGGSGLGYVGAGGIYLSFGATGIYRVAAPYDATTLAPSNWELLSGSPGAGGAIIDDGVNLYESWLYDYGGQPCYRAPLSAGTPWTQMPAVGQGRGAGTFSYDAGSHVLYSANWGAGLWRLVTR
jgi:hypothetical protein